jgi:hypothetical protein
MRLWRTSGRWRGWLRRRHVIPVRQWRIVTFLATQSEHGTARSILAVLTLPYLGLLLWSWLKPVDVLSTAEIHTEYVSFDVIDSRKAAFHLEGIRIAELGQPGSCEAGLFTPGLRTKVSYGRVGDGLVEITITPAPGATAAAVGLLDRGDGKPSERYTKPIAMEQDGSCLEPQAERPAMRLPIWGQAQIGREFRPAAGAGPPEPSLLIDGKLDVSAHALWTQSLYEVRTVTLPVASRLETSNGKEIWWGVAYVDSMKTAMVAAVATEAPVLALYRPSRTKADFISVSTLTQLTDDPTIIRIHILLLVLAALAAIAEWVAKHFHDGRKP